MSCYLKYFSGNTGFKLKKKYFSKICQYLQILILCMFNRQFCCFFPSSKSSVYFLKNKTSVVIHVFFKNIRVKKMTTCDDFISSCWAHL